MCKYMHAYVYVYCPIRGYSEGLLAERIRGPMSVGSDFANFSRGYSCSKPAWAKRLVNEETNFWTTSNAF